MADFTINFFVPISIDMILNTPLFYVKEEKRKSTKESKERADVEREKEESIEEYNKLTGTIVIEEFIKKLKCKVKIDGKEIEFC